MLRDIWSLFEMLLAVVLILFLAYWASRWVGAGGLNRVSMKLPVSNTAELRVLCQISLGRDQRLLLVGLREQCFLLGVTAQQITLLKELDAALAEELLRQKEESAGQAGFLEVLKQSMGKKK